MNYQTQQLLGAMVALMAMAVVMGGMKPMMLQQKSESKDIDDLREVLFTIYDSMSVLAGGSETRLEPELGLLRRKVSELVDRGVLYPSAKEKIVPSYMKAALAGDGEGAHLWSRMLFSEVIGILEKKAKEGRG